MKAISFEDTPLHQRLENYRRSKAGPAHRNLETEGPLNLTILRGCTRSRLAAIQTLRTTRSDLWKSPGLDDHWRTYATKAYPAGIHWRGNDRSEFYTDRPRQFFRFTGYCDDIHSAIRHRGWFVDSFQDETARGIVYQLPARNGECRYLAGVEDPWANTFFETILYEDKVEASRAANGLAESFAEHCREDHEEQERLREIKENQQEATSLRNRIRILSRSIRVGYAHPPEIASAAKRHLQSLRRELLRLNEETAKLAA